MLDTKKVDVRDGVSLIALGDTLLVLWKSPASLDRWAFQVNRMETMCVSRAQGIVCLGLIMEDSDPPNAALRQQMQADLTRMGVRVRRLIVVPLGNSLWLSLVRTIARGVLLLSGHSQQQRVCADVRQGLDQVRAAAGPETPSIAELLRGVEAISLALGFKASLAA